MSSSFIILYFVMKLIATYGQISFFLLFFRTFLFLVSLVLCFRCGVRLDSLISCFLPYFSFFSWIPSSVLCANYGQNLIFLVFCRTHAPTPWYTLPPLSSRYGQIFILFFFCRTYTLISRYTPPIFPPAVRSSIFVLLWGQRTDRFLFSCFFSVLFFFS